MLKTPPSNVRVIGLIPGQETKVPHSLGCSQKLKKRGKTDFLKWRDEKISQFKANSVTQSCLTLCDHMDCSTPGSPVHHQLPKPTQTHVR